MSFSLTPPSTSFDQSEATSVTTSYTFYTDTNATTNTNININANSYSCIGIKKDPIHTVHIDNTSNNTSNNNTTNNTTNNNTTNRHRHHNNYPMTPPSPEPLLGPPPLSMDMNLGAFSSSLPALDPDIADINIRNIAPSLHHMINNTTTSTTTTTTSITTASNTSNTASTTTSVLEQVNICKVKSHAIKLQ